MAWLRLMANSGNPINDCLVGLENRCGHRLSYWLDLEDGFLRSQFYEKEQSSHQQDNTMGGDLRNAGKKHEVSASFRSFL